ncbi:hypothetical protein NSK_003310 [Nannochloropsis salina CCMP1776]|uniref:Uncharacterized protein n=1 Tax=Nannochloropsis salina CCMP1776 TaxID=1027361 RepID=A0A4D9D602_9STRA|nr:hypothetical protein NSK_003310 [Nannochloropsis salina CCMP1776]|eukprot:TFJ85413.1 hypothetical protein NSK_003310 [Nannochloropsis salina CCMP1776]
MVAPGAGGGGDGGAAAGAAEEEKQEEKDAFDVKLVSFEDKSKIKVIKEAPPTAAGWMPVAAPLLLYSSARARSRNTGLWLSDSPGPATPVTQAAGALTASLSGPSVAQAAGALGTRRYARDAQGSGKRPCGGCCCCSCCGRRAGFWDFFTPAFLPPRGAPSPGSSLCFPFSSFKAGYHVSWDRVDLIWSRTKMDFRRERRALRTSAKGR